MSDAKGTAYTCKGITRGRCGKNHRSVRTALACIAQDQRDCERQRGYSDRQVVRVDGLPLTEGEFEDG